MGDLRKIMYETQSLSQRPDGPTVGPDRTAAGPGPSTPWAGPAPRGRFARGRQRAVLPRPRRVYLAGVAPRPAPVENGLQLLPMVGRGRYLAKSLGRPSPLGPGQGRARAHAQRRGDRQP